MYRDIEFVCSGNYERSPLAEAIAKRYLYQKNLSYLVDVSSSGTLVDAFQNLNGPELAKVIEPYIPDALERGFMSASEAQQIREGLRVKEIVSEVEKRGEKNNERKLRIILEEKGLFGFFDLNRKPVQTIVRPEAELIIPVDIETYGRVQKIYSGSDISAKIESLGDIEDPFLFTLEEHKVVADQIEETTIEKLKWLLGLW